MNVTQLFDVALAFSSSSLGVAIYVMLTFGTFFITSIFSQKDSLIATTFISLVSAIFLVLLGWLAPFFILVSTIAFVASIVMAITGKGRVPGA